jgi:glycosyltransferase involved in cell wall biosynthesis
VVTAVRNARDTLQRTIDSVQAQTYSDIEHIIVDGASVDGTLDILRRCDSIIDFWLSQPDKGISDAFNKGIALSSGEFVALVNADDWLEPDHITRSIAALTKSTKDFTFGNLIFHDKDGAPIYAIAGDANYRQHLRHAMPALNHPTIICRRTLYERNGLYDLRYRIAMDYEWLLRNHIQGADGEYIPDLTGHMGADGLSQRDIRASLAEVRQSSIAHGYPAFLALTRFYARLATARSRLILEMLLPKPIVNALRRIVNHSFRATVPERFQ